MLLEFCALVADFGDLAGRILSGEQTSVVEYAVYS